MAKIMKKDAEKLLGNTPEEYAFKCCDGREFSKMAELGQALASMGDEVYAYHKNEGKSDFSAWVKDIIGDEKLARDLDKSRSKSQAKKSVEDRIAFLNSKILV